MTVPVRAPDSRRVSGPGFIGLTSLAVFVLALVAIGAVALWPQTPASSGGTSNIPAACSSAAALKEAKAQTGSNDDTTLIAGNERSAEVMAAWDEAGPKAKGIELVSPLESLSHSSKVAVCEYHGSFEEPMPPTLPSTTPIPLPDTLVLFVLPDGSVVMDQSWNSGVVDVPLPQ